MSTPVLPMVRGANFQAGTGEPPAGLPLLVIVDHGAAPARDGWMYRLMDAADMTKLAAGSRVQLWNESDGLTDRLERLRAVSSAHELGLQVVYGGDVVAPATGWSYPPDLVVLTECDYYGLHATVNSPVPPATRYGKPVVVCELEKTPNVDSEWTLVPPWMAVCPVPVFYFAYRWRDNASQGLDLADHPDIMARIVALNTQGGTNMGTPAEADPNVVAQERAQEEAQFSHEAEALYALVKIAMGDTGQDWLANARAQVAALAPDHFTF